MKKLLFLLGIVVTTSISSFGYWFSESGWGPNYGYSDIIDFNSFHVYFYYYAFRNGNITDYTHEVYAGGNFVYGDGWAVIKNTETSAAHTASSLYGWAPDHISRYEPHNHLPVAWVVTWAEAPLAGDYAYIYYYWY